MLVACNADLAISTKTREIGGILTMEDGLVVMAGVE